MYLHTILQKDKNELVRRVYEAQKNDPTPGDFIELVTEDCTKIGLDMSDNDISVTSKQQFRKIVKSKITMSAFIHLQELKQSHSKMKNLKYDKYEVAEYLKSPMFSNNTRNTLLALRTRTVRGIRSDFGSLYTNKMCPLRCGDNDNLENILTCSVLKKYHKSTEMAPTNCKYEDIFSKIFINNKK